MVQVLHTGTSRGQLVVARAGRRIDPRPGAVAVAASVLLVTGSADARGPLARCPSGSASTSGAIEFCDIRVGRGREALAGDNVVVTLVARGESMDRVFASQRNFEVPVGDPAQKMGQMGSGVDGLRAFDAVVLGQPGMPPMREGGVRLAHLPPEEAYGERGMGCSTTKATKGQRVGCIVPPGEPVELLVEYIERGF